MPGPNPPFEDNGRLGFPSGTVTAYAEESPIQRGQIAPHISPWAWPPPISSGVSGRSPGSAGVAVEV